MRYERRLDARRPPGRSPSSTASRGAGGRLRGRRSSPEWGSRRRPEFGSGRKRATGHGEATQGAPRHPGVISTSMQCKGTAVSSSSHDGGKDTDLELGSLRDDSYGTRAREKAEGRGLVAHGELAGADGGAGGASERVGRRGKSPAADGEGDDDGDEAEPYGLFPSAWRRGSRQRRCRTRRRGERRTVATRVKHSDGGALSGEVGEGG